MEGFTTTSSRSSSTKLRWSKSKALEVAKNLKALGMDTETIRQITGLTTEDI